MNKILPLIVVLAVLGGIGAGVYFLFMQPTGYTDSKSVVTAFMNDMDSTNCDAFFMEETIDICTNLTDVFEDVEFTINSIEASSNEVTVTITINEVETSLIFTTIAVEVTGLQGVLTDNYFYIDTFTD